MAWDLYLTDEVDRWLDDLAASEADSYAQVVAGIVGPHRDPGAVRVRPMAQRDPAGRR